MKVAGNDLRAALGHPESQSRLAADQLDLAHRTLYMDAAPAGPRFEAALSNNDLNEAKAANAIEQDALQRYIDRLDTIEWPPGVEDQVNTLRDNLRRPSSSTAVRSMSPPPQRWFGLRRRAPRKRSQ